LEKAEDGGTVSTKQKVTKGSLLIEREASNGKTTPAPYLSPIDVKMTG